MKLSSLLSENNILIDPPVETKEEAIQRLVATFEPTLGIAKARVALDHLFQREKKISSYIDYGVAIPHTKIEGLDRVLVGLITSARHQDPHPFPGSLAYRKEHPHVTDPCGGCSPVSY